jgi:hypothetical protein
MYMLRINIGRPSSCILCICIVYASSIIWTKIQNLKAMYTDLMEETRVSSKWLGWRVRDSSKNPCFFGI